MEELSLREIQLAELEVLLRFDEICKNNNYKYFLSCGTLLGAIRHKGFIPWDDDVDVMMPREDFQKFCAWIIANPQKDLEFCSRANTPNYVYGIPRLSDKRYRYISNKTNMKNIEIGAFIDIYPIDSFGSSLEYAKVLSKKI